MRRITERVLERIVIGAALLAIGQAMAAPAIRAQAAPPERDPLARLAAVLPAEIAAGVLERVEAAQARGLPTAPVANLALEGATKGRSGPETIAAVDALIVGLQTAGDALREAGRAPDAYEVEAAAVAMRMGVDGATVAMLARSSPAGRSLSVPLLVLGGLAQRGLPSDEALTRVLERLSARAGDAALLGELGRAGNHGRGRGFGPPEGHVPGPAGLPTQGPPGAGPLIPGPPDGVGPPAGRPGRGRPGGPPTGG